MPTITKTIRIVLIVLTIFLALSAFAGGIQLIEGAYAPPANLLAGSPFDSYVIPGLALGLIVGGSALFAAVFLIRKSRFALLASVAAGLIIMFFEFVEVLVIGSPAGPAFILQVFYFGLGIVIAVVSLGQWFFELLAGGQTAPQFSA
jgi:hypothetical protein